MHVAAYSTDTPALQLVPCEIQRDTECDRAGQVKTIISVIVTIVQHRICESVTPLGNGAFPTASFLPDSSVTFTEICRVPGI